MNERATLLTTTGNAGLGRVCLMKLEKKRKVKKSGLLYFRTYNSSKEFSHFLNEILAATLK